MPATTGLRLAWPAATTRSLASTARNHAPVGVVRLVILGKGAHDLVPRDDTPRLQVEDLSRLVQGHSPGSRHGTRSRSGGATTCISKDRGGRGWQGEAHDVWPGTRLPTRGRRASQRCARRRGRTSLSLLVSLHERLRDNIEADEHDLDDDANQRARHLSPVRGAKQRAELGPRERCAVMHPKMRDCHAEGV